MPSSFFSIGDLVVINVVRAAADADEERIGPRLVPVVLRVALGGDEDLVVVDLVAEASFLGRGVGLGVVVADADGVGAVVAVAILAVRRGGLDPEDVLVHLDAGAAADVDARARSSAGTGCGRPSCRSAAPIE